MNHPSSSVRELQKPGWSLPLLFLGLVSAVLHFGGVRSWWALLWAPLFVLAVGATVYEWRLLARSRWRMGPLEWVFLAITHLVIAASLATVLGLLRD
ncbi:hypothetical protein OG756_19310 [Streptomyces sp. NBC_01310]|uniref:hypothetical protein n=1 Tax=Streptomyces sp. NBC_01310 TaxID=2903820 RepID=UPI0035B65C8E|nr:hypothetical protein OG756_19310 [Streptomyces sp. NBC_01310]